jgi:putative toxin-antitoxin system antitoxin component (TIGR02293 family)
MGELLGGRKVLGRLPITDLDFVPMVRAGLRYAAFETATRQLDLSFDEATRSLRLPKRTIARRKEAGRLDPIDSERLVRLVSMAARAMEVLGGDREARRWIHASNRALGGERPIDLLDTDIGAQAVTDVLGRIEHGVYS